MRLTHIAAGTTTEGAGQGHSSLTCNKLLSGDVA